MAESQLINNILAAKEEEEEILIRRHESETKKKGLMPDDNKRPWPDLPSDVRNYIYSYLLSAFDCIRFRLTCKEWQLAVKSPLILHPPLMIQLEEDYYCYSSIPWLMFFSKPKSRGEFDFFHPITNETYTMHIPELANCTFHCSRYGWLLMSRAGTHSFFFYNPFIPRSTINLPDLFHKYRKPDVISMSFTTPPTCPDCTVFVVAQNYHSTNIYTCCRGEDQWSTTDHNPVDIQSFDACHCTPVYYKGVFYQLDTEGRLGTLDMKEFLDNDGNPPSFKPLSKPTKPNIPDTVAQYNNYIAECDGEFVSVFVDSKVGYPVHVFKLDWSEMEWMTVTSLGNRTMFISETTGCLLVPAAKTTYQNKIYFSNFRNKKGGEYHVTKDKACVFYSLETRKYHAFGCDFASQNSNEMESLPDSVWIEPNVNITKDQVEDNWFKSLKQDYADNDCELNVQQRQWDQNRNGDDNKSEDQNEDDRSNNN